MSATWLAEVLRSAGCKVTEVSGWQARGRALPTIEGVVWHHTATGPGWTDARVAELLRYGRSDLAGPLSQLGLQRDGTFVLVAAGRANHNGYGEWGNSSIGIEAYNDGVGESWPKAQTDAYVLGTAAILNHLDLTASRCKGHKETDPNRKIDPAGLSMSAMRTRVQRTMADLKAPVVKPWVAPPFPGRTLRLGSIGDDVAAWKLLLIAAGHGKTVSVNGNDARIFGPGTVVATRALMKDYYRVKNVKPPVGQTLAVGPVSWAWACDVVKLRKAQGKA